MQLQTATRWQSAGEKNPAAKGGLGAVLGLAREAPDGCGITEIAVCVVDGKRYLPDVYYDVNGNQVLM